MCDTGGTTALDLRPARTADNPVLTAAAVDDAERVRFVADPFVVRDDGRYHLFFEVKRRGRRRVPAVWHRPPRFDVGHATSPDGVAWTYDGVVLPAAQAEHTYPYVFRHDGAWLMTPSPAGRTPDEFRVYRARAFPRDWRLVDRALTGEVRIDPTPFRFDGTWFLPYQEAGSFDVCLRYADSLVGGDWTEHPASPLFEPGGNDVACGGRPLVRDGGVDLFFRRGTPGLVEHWRVTDLTTDRLAWHETASSPVVAGVGGPGWNGRNMHHVDAGLAARDPSEPVLVDGQDEAGQYRIGVYRVSDARDDRATG